MDPAALLTRIWPVVALDSGLLPLEEVAVRLLNGNGDEIFSDITNDLGSSEPSAVLDASTYTDNFVVEVTFETAGGPATCSRNVALSTDSPLVFIETACVAGDTVPPVTTAENVPPGWVADSIELTLTTAPDVSGVASTHYCVVPSGDTCDPYMPVSGSIGNSVLVSESGSWDVIFGSKDNSGNNEIPKTATVMIDRTPPAAYIHILSQSGASAYMGETLGFTAQLSTDAESGIANYSWDFTGERAFGVEGVSVSHTFLRAGVYEIVLRVTDNVGNEGFHSLEITVEAESSEVTAGPDRAVQYSDSLSFGIELSLPGEYDGYTFEWDFGDETPPVFGSYVEHAWLAQPGVYQVTLSITDPDGRTTVDGAHITVARETLGIWNAGGAEGTYMETVELTATLSAQDAEPGAPETLEGKTVYWNIGELVYSTVTGPGGEAALPVQMTLPPGVYALRVVSPEDTYYEQALYEGQFVVLPNKVIIAGEMVPDPAAEYSRPVFNYSIESYLDSTTTEGTVYGVIVDTSNGNAVVASFTDEITDLEPWEKELRTARFSPLEAGPGQYMLAVYFLESPGAPPVMVFTAPVAIESCGE